MNKARTGPRKIVLGDKNVAKGIDEPIPYEAINPEVKELVLKGNCVSYDEVFNAVESITFRDEENKLIYVDDQYCMNPKCQCDEVFLTFVEFNEEANKAKNELTLRYSLNNGKYEFEFKSCTEERLKEILKGFKEEEKQIREKLKKRVKAMKEVGGEIIRESRAEKPKETDEVKVGRNDMCPCGSGKKYKKCCGR